MISYVHTNPWSMLMLAARHSNKPLFSSVLQTVPGATKLMWVSYWQHALWPGCHRNTALHFARLARHAQAHNTTFLQAAFRTATLALWTTQALRLETAPLKLKGVNR